MTASMGSTPNRLSFEDLKGNAHRHRRERGVRYALTLAGLTSLVISALIVGSLVKEAWTFISEVEWASLWTTGWFPRDGFYDIKTLMVATLIVTGLAMVIAGPLGFAVAVYLSEYAKPEVRRVLKPTIEILAGIPSVVIGFFALTFISPNIIQNLNANAPLSNLAAAGLGVGMLTIPLVASISEDAMRSVPRELREASAGLGAHKATTTMRIVVPAAISGLVAAFIVSVSRAIGETMVVFIAAGGGGQASFTTDPFEPGMTMTAAMASLASGTDAVVGEGLTFQSLFFVGLLLFTITFGLNIIGDRFVRRVRQKY
ncbi:MAG: phosphate ABC transporter permease subunit PstC [Acidimicrobiia bacterium]|nr:phosphate ABC transporter permease subunit PstC [Acidimicrobiia bacterium]